MKDDKIPGVKGSGNSNAPPPDNSGETSYETNKNKKYIDRDAVKKIIEEEFCLTAVA